MDWNCGQHLDNDIEQQACAGFVGREAILTALDRWLLDDKADHRVVVTGGPGMGKTAILTAWLARRQTARAVVAHHFIRRDRYGWSDPLAIARSIAAQIEDRYPAHRDPDARPEAHLHDLLARVSARELVPSGGRLVLLVDGLDEYDVPAEVCDPLAAVLPDALPRGVRLLCASRPAHPHLEAFESRHGELVRIDLDHPSAADDNDASVRAFWCREAQRLGLDDRFVERAVLRAYGNMQHATLLRSHLASVPRSERSAGAIPRGLPDLLATLWQRMAGDPLAVHGLGILCAAREPLALDEIGRAAGWTGIAEQRAFAHVAHGLVVEARRGDGVAEYRLGHDSVRAFVVGQLGPGAIRGHHEALARRLATWPASRGAATRRYALRHALAHRVEAGDWPAVQDIACDLGFLEAKARELGFRDVEADVMRAAGRCRASGDTAIGRALSDVARALARQSNWMLDDAATLVSSPRRPRKENALRDEEVDRVGAMPGDDTEVRPRGATTQVDPGPLPDLRGHGGAAIAPAVAPDGHRTVSVSGAMREILDRDIDDPIPPLDSHAGRAALYPTAANGHRQVSAASGTTLRMWAFDAVRILRRPPKPPSPRKAILFLAANPKDSDRLLLDEECAAIERELQLATHGEGFEFRSKWAVTADEMARHLFKLEPTVVHFSGHGAGGAGGRSSGGYRDLAGAGESGIYLQDDQGRSQLLPATALAGIIASSTPSTRVVVLNTCYSDHYAEALCGVVECVVGMAGTIHDDAARSFAVAFYRALGHRRSVSNAMEHARATLAAKQLPDERVPRCRTRNWVDPDQIFL